jgi:hypothetical protein
MLSTIKHYNYLPNVKDIAYTLRLLGTIALVSLSHIQLFSQEEDNLEYENFWANGKEVGINVTNLLSRFVPFNLTGKDDINQFIALKTKWYGGGNKAFIINFGIDISENMDNDENKLFLSIGYEHRRNISNKWKYVTGWELAGTNLGTTDFDNSPYLAVSKPFGIEYHFFDNFYISTEARFMAGVGGNGPIFKLFYPSSIFFNMLLD